jgi:ribosome-binding factor A
MPKDYGRNERIADQIRRDLAELLLYEVKDPRLQSITISEVLIDRDLSLARVLISAASESECREQILSLERASGFLRSKLARRLRLRNVPRLRFEFDPLPEHASRIEALLAGKDLDGVAERSPARTDAIGETDGDPANGGFALPVEKNDPAERGSGTRTGDGCN